MTALFVGIDTGGTFTDLVLLREGEIRVHKVLSTPDDPSRAILQGLVNLGVVVETGAEVLKRAPQASLRPLHSLVHGSTVATNAVLEHKGVRTGLITTAGFRDVLEIGRQTRPKLYELRVQKEPPLVPRWRRVEVVERLNERGEVLIPFDEMSLKAAIEQMQVANVEAVAICLLFSFTNPDHERKVAEAARAAGFYVSVSSEVLPEFREYERTSTVVLNAYVGPLIDRYLKRLEDSLERIDMRSASFAEGPYGTRLRIMQSNGGSISSARARREAARTLLSGPAAGVVGAAFVAEASGFKRAITIDIGGTSTDVALIDGAIAETTDGKIGGYPIKLPMIDIHTVGAGGGSIAWFDAGGALRVGPRSAGADPGPAAYGRGGSEPTVTDANIVLGRLLPEAFLGGSMSLDSAQARNVVAPIAQRLGTGVEEAALGIVRIANANMEAAMRVISVERGFDPRNYILVAFGGAGPLHACELAAALQIPKVLIPTTPGVLSALGMLAADIVKDYVRTIMVPAEDAQESVEKVFSELEVQGRADLALEGFSVDDPGLLRTQANQSERVTIERALDLRYVGQSYELIVPFADEVAGAVTAFHAVHERRFGYNNPGERVQVVNVRLKARGITTKPVLERREEMEQATITPVAVRSVIFATNGSAPQDTALYTRETLPAGGTFTGPAIVTQYDTTTVLPPGWLARIDAIGNIIAESTEKE
jgi:N-methylhydantoinase A